MMLLAISDTPTNGWDAMIVIGFLALAAWFLWLLLRD